MARLVLFSHVHDENVATRILETAFGGDERLSYEQGAWGLGPESDPGEGLVVPRARPEPDRALLVVEGTRPARGVRFEIARIAAVRVRGDAVVQGCGGDLGTDRSAANEMRDALRDVLDGAVPIVHDAPGAIAAFERWLEEPIPEPLSLRRLASFRLGLPMVHDLETLVGRLGIPWTMTDDPASAAEALDGCLEALRRPGEGLEEMLDAARAGGMRVPWERFGFDRAFLRSLPDTAGTYRFLDHEGTVVYVGRSRNLRSRLQSYFRQGGPRDRRVERLLGLLHRIEIEPSHSDLEAVLEEAHQIAERKPRGNVQVELRTDSGRGARLRSILILEPAAPPVALRAYLVRDGVLLDRVGIGPRGGGLRRIRRVLEDRFFSYRAGPGAERETPVDVELIARWLGTHRDRVVAFDPTHFKNADEVVARLRWFLDRGALEEPGGGPVVPR